MPETERNQQPVQTYARFVVTYTAITVLILGMVWLFLDDYMTEWIRQWHRSSTSSGSVYAAIVILILGSDLLLPIPSSVVMTHCGMTLGLGWGVLSSFTGLTLGSLVGFGLGRAAGQGMVDRFVKAEDQNLVKRLIDRNGVFALITLRSVPIFAEASLLLFGMAKMSWRKFLPWMLLSNLVICITFTGFGIWTVENEFPQLWAIVISILIPVLLWVAVRFLAARFILEKPHNVDSEKTV